ncbi:MAG TPA: hypothetical protein VFL82_10755 [Thermomicrobiales bacterium]|nr:hypothetical protein [Thermomicrobiales bacterium]
MVMRKAVGFGLIALGAGVAVSSLLGPLVLNVIRFRTSENIENQFIGGDAVSLGLVAPVAIVAGVLWLRDHRLAPALALAPALYAVYTYTSVVLGQEYSRYAGNVEKFFPLYAGLVAASGVIAAAAWSRLGRVDLVVPSIRLRRGLAGIFIGVGGLFALAWARQIQLVVSGHPTTEYLEGPTLFWLIKLLDFGFVIPAMLATGVGLLRAHPAAVKAAYGLAGFLTCLGGSIAGMAVAMELKQDPSSQPLMIVILLPATAGLALLTASLLRTSLRSTGTTTMAGSGSVIEITAARRTRRLG